MSVTTTSLRLVQTSNLTNGTYKAQVSGNNTTITTPTNNLFNGVSSKSLISFTLNNAHVPNVTSISAGKKSPGIHVISNTTDVVTFGGYYPYIHDQGICVLAKWINSQKDEGWLIIKSVVGIVKVSFTTTTQAVPVLTTDHGVVNYIAPRFLRAEARHKLDSAIGLNIDTCYFGEFNGRNAIWLPIIADTTITYANMGNRIVGYQAVPEVISPTQHNSLILEEGDVVYYCSVDARDYQPSGFPDSVVEGIVDNLPDVNGDKLRWIAIAFQTLEGLENSPLLIKLYNVTDTGVELVNFYRDNLTDYSDYNNGVAGQLPIDETYFVETALSDNNITSPSVFSHATNLNLTVEYESQPLDTIHASEVKIRRTDTGILLYIPALMGTLDFTKVGERSDCHIFKIPDITLWSTLQKLTHAHVYYTNDGQDYDQIGLWSANSLTIQPLSVEKVKLTAHIYDPTTYKLIKIDIATTILSSTVPGIVSVSGNTPSFAYKSLVKLNGEQHYFNPATLTDLPADAEQDMIQPGDEPTTMARIYTVFPRQIAGFDYLRTVSLQRNFSETDKSHVFTVDVDMQESDTLAVYANLALDIPFDMPPRGTINITVVDSSVLDYSYTLTNPAGVIRVGIDFKTEQLYHTIGDNTSSHNITLDANGWTPLIHIRVSEESGNTRIALYADSTMVSNDVIASPWSDKYTVHVSTSSIAKAGTIRLANFGAYRKGTAITGNRMLPFVKRNGDIDASVVTWELANESAVGWDSDLRSRVNLYVPKFYLDDNPFTEGVYKVTLGDDVGTTELAMVVFPVATVVDLRSVPSMVNPPIPVTKQGEIYVAISKTISDHTAPLKVSTGVKLGDSLVTHHVDSVSVAPHPSGWIGSYDESNFMDSFVEGPHQYALSGLYTPIMVSTPSSLPNPLDSAKVYIVSGTNNRYAFIFNSGILTFDGDANTSCVLSCTLSGVDVSSLQEIAIVPNDVFQTSGAYAAFNSNILQPTTDKALLIYQKYTNNPPALDSVTLEYAFRESEAFGNGFRWKSTTIPGVGSSLKVGLARRDSSVLSDSLIRGSHGEAFTGPMLLNLVHSETIPTTINPNEVVLTRDNDDKLILILASAWVSKDDTDYGCVKFPLESINSQASNRILSSIFISRYIIMDASVSDGSGLNIDISPVGSEALSLSLNTFTNNAEYTLGFTLAYRYRDAGINTTYEWSSDTSQQLSSSVLKTPFEVAFPKATHVFTSEYPHGLITYGNDPSNMVTSEAYIDEAVDGSTHTITLTIPAKAFYSNNTSQSFIRYEFDIETPYRTEYAASALGVCVSRNPDDLQSLPYYTRGNISIHTARTGVVVLYYFNGEEWNDILFYTQDIIIHDTLQNPNRLPLTTCESIRTPDDIFHRPVVLRSIYKLSSTSTMAGNEVYTQLNSLGVTIYLANIWISLDRNDNSVVSFTATSPKSMAIHHVRTVVMYAGTNRGSISSIPMPGQGTETVILSRNATGISLYIVKNGIVVHQEDMVPTSTASNVPSMPVIPPTPTYTTGFTPLQRKIGKGIVQVRNLSDLGDTLPSEASYIVNGNEHRLYFLSMVLSGNLDDTSMVYVIIDNLSLRAKLLTGPDVCFFNGQVGVTGLDRSSGVIYIGRDDFNHATIVFNTDDNPYLAISEIPLHYTSSKVPLPRAFSFQECGVDIGCDTALLGGADIHTEYIDTLVPIVGANASTRYFVTANSLLMQCGDTDLTPVNVSYDIPPMNFDDVFGFSFHCRREPRGETSIQPVGLPTSLEGFMITLTEVNAAHIQHYGSNLLPSVTQPGITVTFGRYSNTQVVIRENHTNRILLTRDVNPLPGLSVSSDNPKNIDGGYHDIKIAVIRGGVGTFVYVYVNDRLLSYTVDTITWFEPKSVSLHFHNNYHELATENILYPRLKTRLVEIGCLPYVVDKYIDCPNKEPNLTAAMSMVLVKDTLHMVTGLQAVCNYGYFHITLSNPTNQISNIELYVADTRFPIAGDELDMSPVTLPPSGVVEIPLVTISGDQKLFVKSNTSGPTLRSCSMENVISS